MEDGDARGGWAAAADGPPPSPAERRYTHEKPTVAEKRMKMISFLSYLIFMGMLISLPLTEYKVGTSFGLSDTLNKLFAIDHRETFKEIHTIDDLRAYAEEVFLPAVYCQHDPKLGTGARTDACHDRVITAIDPAFVDVLEPVVVDTVFAPRCNEAAAPAAGNRTAPGDMRAPWERRDPSLLAVDEDVDYCAYDAGAAAGNQTCSDSSSLVTRIGKQNVLLGGVGVGVKLSTSVCNRITKSGAMGEALGLLGGRCRSDIDDGEDKTAYGRLGRVASASEPARYVWRERAIRAVEDGPFARSDGYAVTLPPGRRGALCLSQLFRDALIGVPRTREVSFTLLLYNPYENIAGRYTLRFKFEATGYTDKRHYFSSYHMWRVGGGFVAGRARTALIVSLLVFFVLYAAITLLDFFRCWAKTVWRRVDADAAAAGGGGGGAGPPGGAWEYQGLGAVLFGWLFFFNNGFHVIDFLNIGMCSYIVYLRREQFEMMDRVEASGLRTSLQALAGARAADASYVGPIHRAMDMKAAETDWLTVNIIISFFKMFKFLMHFRRLSLPIHTIGASARELLYFGVLVVGNLAAFIIIGHFAFGVYVRDFRTIKSSVKSMVGFILGDFSVGEKELYQINPTIAVVFFYAYVLYVVVFLYNVALGILLYAYSERRKQLKPINLRRSITNAVRRMRQSRSASAADDAPPRSTSVAMAEGRPRGGGPGSFMRRKRTKAGSADAAAAAEGARRSSTFNPLFNRIVSANSSAGQEVGGIDL